MLKTIPKAVHWVRDLAALRAITDSQRHAILTELIRRPMTARELAAALRLPQTKLYYHLKLLEQHGYVAVVDERLAHGILERRYSAVAQSFRIDHALIGAGDASAAVEATTVLLDATARDLRVKSNIGDDCVVARTLPRLSRKRYRELHARLHALIAEFNDDANDAGGSRASLTIALFPNEETNP
jgi:DNA-binding transcriptional ArsR family regulator